MERKAGQPLSDAVLGEAYLVYAVAGVGDTNRDGYDDILVTDTWNGDHNQGAAYLVLGPLTGELDFVNADAMLMGFQDWQWSGQSAAGAADFTVLGNAADQDIGMVIEMVGDGDGDGLDDLLPANPYAAGEHSAEGAVYYITASTLGF